MERTIKVELTGVRPLLCHNGRLANPLDRWTQQVAAISKKRNKTLADHAELATIEARGGMYETPDGMLGLPVVNVWRCLYDAAKAYKLGQAIKQALLPTPEIVPILLEGAPQPCDGYLGRHADRLHYASVVVNRNRTMRARALVPAGWEATVSMVLLDEVIDVSKLKPVLERAGKLGGLCDWRPLFGTFTGELIG